jgi:hypothetical protein
MEPPRARAEVPLLRLELATPAGNGGEIERTWTCGDWVVDLQIGIETSALQLQIGIETSAVQRFLFTGP